MSHAERAIRPLDPFRDLEEVVDLIEIAFGDRLDPAGRATLDRMRRFARGGLWRQWLWAFLGRATVAPGLVWVDDGRVVGNVSLRRARTRDGYLIGNVVVHPEFRRQGIARALMKAAIDRVSRRGVQWVGLEVRADNDAARALYEDLGFREVGRMRHMLRPGGPPRGDRPSADVARPDLVRRGTSRDGDALVELMRAVIPEALRPLLEGEESDYRPGWTRRCQHWLRGEREVWWVVDDGDGLRGAVRAVRRAGRFPNQLEMLVRPGEGGCAGLLVERGLASLSRSPQSRSPQKPAEVSLPTTAPPPLLAALEVEGFRETRVLIQMKRRLGRRIPIALKGTTQRKTGPL